MINNKVKSYIEGMDLLLIQSGEIYKECKKILADENICIDDLNQRVLWNRLEGIDIAVQAVRGIDGLKLISGGIGSALLAGEDLYIENRTDFPLVEPVARFEVQDQWRISQINTTGKVEDLKGSIVVTKYVNITTAYILSQGYLLGEILNLSRIRTNLESDRVYILPTTGSTEGYISLGNKLGVPIKNIFDIVRSGATIEANGLKEVQTIAECSIALFTLKQNYN